MSQKHTPGPWLYRSRKHDDWGWVRAGDETLVACAKDSSVPHSAYDAYRARKADPFEANARLIAAAPEMLEALKKATATLVALTSIVIRAEDEKKRPSKVVASDAMFLEMLRDFDKATLAARAAIAKAEGGQLAAAPASPEPLLDAPRVKALEAALKPFADLSGVPGQRCFVQLLVCPEGDTAEGDWSPKIAAARAALSDLQSGEGK